MSGKLFLIPIFLSDVSLEGVPRQMRTVCYCLAYSFDKRMAYAIRKCQNYVFLK